jgi:hypothetical protein
LQLLKKEYEKEEKQSNRDEGRGHCSWREKKGIDGEEIEVLARGCTKLAEVLARSALPSPRWKPWREEEKTHGEEERGGERRRKERRGVGKGGEARKGQELR